MSTRKPPWRDPALPPLKSPGPQHEFEGAWYFEPRCLRCRKTASEVAASKAPCISDEVIAARRAVQRIMRR